MYGVNAAGLKGCRQSSSARADLRHRRRFPERPLRDWAERKQARVGLGNTVSVTLQLDQESREIPMPDELAEALRTNDLLDKFNALTPGQRRAALQWLQSAKTRPTWERRVETLVMRLATKGNLLIW